MSRPLKDGVDYFPKDTDFYSDYKVRLLRAEFGAKGMYLLDYLLCELYGKNGYFLPWDRNVQLLVADAVGCGCEPQYISEFVAGAARCSFFDERVRNAFGILTSAGIQRRYIRMFNSREEIQIIKEYWLLDETNKKDVPTSILNKLTFKSIKNTENPDKSTGSPIKSTDNVQSKEKESKVKKSKKTTFDIIAFLDPFNFSNDFKNVFYEYAKMRIEKGKPLTELAAKKVLNKLQGFEYTEVQLIECLNNSIISGWDGVFPLKQSQYDSVKPPSTKDESRWY